MVQVVILGVLGVSFIPDPAPKPLIVEVSGDEVGFVRMIVVGLLSPVGCLISAGGSTVFISMLSKTDFKSTSVWGS